MLFDIQKIKEEEYSWLKKSSFYEQLDNFDDIIDIKCFCSENTSNFKKFIDCIDFWDVYYFPPKFFDLLLKIKPINYLKKLYNTTNSKKYKFLIDMCHSNEDDITNLSVKNEFIDAVEYCYNKKYYWDEITFLFSIETGNLEIVQFLYEKGCPYDDDAIKYSVTHNHLHIFKYLYEKANYHKYLEEFLKLAIESKKSCILKYLHEKLKVKLIDDLAILSVKNNNLESLKYLHNKITFPENLLYKSIKYCNTGIIKYLHDIGYEYNERLIVRAIDNHRFDILVFLHENGCPLGDESCKSAALNDEPEFLKYLIDNNCRPNQEALTICYENSLFGFSKCYRYLKSIGY